MIPFTFFNERGERRLLKISRPAPIQHMAYEMVDWGYGFESEIQCDGRVRLDCARPEDTETISDELVANSPEDIEEGFDRMVMFAYVRATRRQRPQIATPAYPFPRVGP